jgi:hypothetical protein
VAEAAGADTRVLSGRSNQIRDETAAFFGGHEHVEALFGIRVWTAIRHHH